MSEERRLAVVKRLLASLGPGEFDMKDVVGVSPFSDELREVLAADAPVEFVVPGGGFVGPMAGPFTGPDGYEAGWREWLDTVDAYRVRMTDLVAGAEDKVLLLVDAWGRAKGTDVDLEHEGAIVYTVEGERVTKIEHFLDHAQARQAAGLA